MSNSVTHSESGGRKRVYNREWAYQKLLYCLDKRRSIPRTCGILLFGSNASDVSLFCFDVCQPINFSSKAELLNRQMLAYYFTKPVPEDYQQTITTSLSGILPSSLTKINDNEQLQSPIRFIVFMVNFLLNYYEEQRFSFAEDDTDSDKDFNEDMSLQEKRRICGDFYKKWSSETILRKSFERISDVDDLFRQVFIFPLLEIDPPRVPLFILIDSIDLPQLATMPSHTVSDLIANNHHLLPKWLLLALTARKQTRAIVKAFTGFRRLNLAFENDLVESRPSSADKMSLCTATSLVELIRNCNDNRTLVEKFVEDSIVADNSVHDLLNECDSEGWNPLRVAAWYGYVQIISYLISLQNSCEIDSIDEERRTALRVASWCGHCDVVQLLLANGANVNFTDRDGRTALVVAAHMGHFEIVQTLLDHGADLHLTDIDGRSALMIASFSRHDNAKRIVNHLLECGANVNQSDIDGATALLIAAHAGNKDICELLLEYDADIEKTDDSGTNALWAATGMGYDTVVELLLFWGSSIDLMDRDGRTVLSLAASRGHVDVVVKLLNRGLDEQHRDNAGWTPLHYSTIENHIAVCELLLESGASIDISDNEGRTPVMLAAEAGFYDLVKLFVEDYETNCDRKPHDGRTALRLAAIENHFNVVDLLLTNGADINSQDSDGRSILYILAWENNLEMASHLIDRNANVEAQDSEGRNALQVSAWQGHYDMVELLLSKGRAKVDSVDFDNRTALHSASWQGHCEIVELLLKHKADPNHACKQGATALCIAAQEGHEKCVITLLRYGASPFKSDACGRTALLVAVKSGHERIVHMLEVYQQKLTEKKLHKMSLKPSSPLYVSPPVSPFEDLQEIFDNMKVNTELKSNEIDNIFSRNGHMQIILDNSKIKNQVIQFPHEYNTKKSFKSTSHHRSAKKPKRNGIVTNPALRLMAGVKSGLDSAAANLRKSSANPSQKTNSFQWRRETPL